jgi:adenine-specific DNA-methyltransferase
MLRYTDGIVTGYNDAFIIDTDTRNRILANCKDERGKKENRRNYKTSFERQRY